MSFKGEISIVELPIARSWTKNGWSVTRKFRGTPTAIAAKIYELQYDGCTITHDPPETGGWESLSCLYAWDPTDPQSQNPETPISDLWSLQGSQLEKRLWEMPKVVAELEKIQDSEDMSKAQQMAFLRKFIESLAQGEMEITNPLTGVKITIGNSSLATLLTGTGITMSVIYGLINSMAKGVESYPVSQYVLRHQLTIGPFCTLQPTYANVGKVYTTTALKTAENIPSTLKFTLPAGVWLKQTPTCEQTGPGKWQITQEWWHADSYDTFIYEVAT